MRLVGARRTAGLVGAARRTEVSGAAGEGGRGGGRLTPGAVVAGVARGAHPRQPVPLTEVCRGTRLAVADVHPAVGRWGRQEVKGHDPAARGANNRTIKFVSVKALKIAKVRRRADGDS